MKATLQALALSVMLFLIAGPACGLPIKAKPVAENGVLDLREWDFSRDGSLPLNGEWEFYWNELLTPKQTQEASVNRPTQFISLPVSWNTSELEGESYPPNGFATFRLRILLNRTDQRLALKIGEIRTAYTTFINGKAVAQAGSVGTSIENARPGFLPQAVGFESTSDNIEIVIHVSNYHQYSAGITTAISLGEETAIRSTWENSIALDLFLFGSCFIIGLYHLGLFFNRKSDQSPLYFGLFCTLIAIRIPTQGNFYIMHLLPGLPFDILIRLDFISFYLAVPSFALFVRSLFPDQFKKAALRTSLALGALYTSTVLLLPIPTFTGFIISYEVFTLIVGSYVIYALVIAVLQKKEGAAIFLMGFFIFFITILNDVLYESDILKIGLMVPAGLLTFIFFQAYLISVRFSRSFAAVENLTEKIQIKSDQLNDTNRTLSALNEELEKKVEERTGDLNNMIQELQISIQTSNQLAQEAQTANIAKSNFLANMSHEIRTPMNGILGMIDLLLDTNLTRDQADYARTVKNSAESLLVIINDILDFSKIEAGKLEFETIDFNLRSAIEEISELLAVKAQEKGLEFIYRVDFNVPPYLRGDPGRLKQVLLNLTGNAIKFTEQGEVIIKVALIEETPTQATIGFEIIDSGIGISAADQKRLFRSFTQVDASITRKYGGTGLGLAISKQLVELMNGKIAIESEPGKGSKFYFKAVFEKQMQFKNAVPIQTNSIEGIKILVVDDIKLNRQLLAEFLNSWHCLFEEAASGEEALEKLSQAHHAGDPFKIAILDMQMPEMDGETLGKKIKEDPDLNSTILIMLTSSGVKGDASRASKIGFAAYLTKPIRQSQLFDCLVTVLGLPTLTDSDQENRPLITRFSLEEIKKPKIRILLAEDNKTNQKLAFKVLEKMGYRIDLVENGREAIKALEITRYDVVLMDLQMPEISGLEATTIIRDPSSHVLDHQVPIIAMTAHAMVGDRKKCLDAGMNGYISKPINKTDLFKEIEKHSRQSKSN